MFCLPDSVSLSFTSCVYNVMNGAIKGIRTSSAVSLFVFAHLDAEVSAGVSLGAASMESIQLPFRKHQHLSRNTKIYFFRSDCGLLSDPLMTDIFKAHRSFVDWKLTACCFLSFDSQSS